MPQHRITTHNRGPPPLQKWYQALAQIPKKERKLLVHSLSNSAEWRFSAWQGDKLLGFAAALAVEKVTDIRNPGDATILTAKALSNQFFATHAATLLPGFPVLINQVGVPHSKRKLGSMLEAAVARVWSSGSLSPTEAIAELAEWLIITANQEKSSLILSSNRKQGGKRTKLLSLGEETGRKLGQRLTSLSTPKGRLIEMGGTVQSRQVGGMPHEPLFEATAGWEQLKLVYVATERKKVVEQRAAEMLWTAARVMTESLSSSSSLLSNHKGRLLELRGTVHSKQVAGPPHRPSFEATAKWSSTEGSFKVSTVLVGTGRKKQVERAVAEMLLAVIKRNQCL